MLRVDRLVAAQPTRAAELAPSWRTCGKPIVSVVGKLEEGESMPPLGPRVVSAVLRIVLEMDFAIEMSEHSFEMNPHDDLGSRDASREHGAVEEPRIQWATNDFATMMKPSRSGPAQIKFPVVVRPRTLQRILSDRPRRPHH